jgi:hypothetical protein
MTKGVPVGLAISLTTAIGGGPPPPPPPPPVPLYTPGQVGVFYNVLTSNGAYLFEQPRMVSIMQVLDTGRPVFHYLVRYDNETPFQVPEYLLYTH